MHCRQRRRLRENIAGQGFEDSAQLERHGNQAMGNGLPQGCLGLEDGQDTDAPAPGGKAALRPVTLKMGLLETRTIDRRRIDGPWMSLLDETGASMKVQQELMRHANVQATMNV